MSTDEQVSSLPLAGVTVLDFSRFLPGQLCTSVLADFGARVIRVENPRDIAKLAAVLNWDRFDDRQRRQLKAADSLARNKQSVAVDLGHPDAHEVLRPLIAAADVLVEDYRPGMLDKLGFGARAVAELNPRLNFCSLSFAGQTGPYRDRPGHDQLGLALTGLLSRIGSDAQQPGFANIPIADVMCGLQAALGIVLALRASERGGAGQHVDVSITESLMPFLAWLLSRQASGVNVPGRGNPRIDLGMWRAADGRLLCLTNMEPRFWDRFCRLIGRADFITRQHDKAGYDEMHAAISAVIGSRPRDEWLALFIEHDIQAAPVNELDEAMADPHLRERGMVEERDEEGVRAIRIAPGLRLSRTPARTGRIGEMPGTSTDRVLREFGHPTQRIEALHASGCILGAGT